MAQSGSATVWGTGGRKFKSCHPDKQEGIERFLLCFICIYKYIGNVCNIRKMLYLCRANTNAGQLRKTITKTNDI